MAELIDPQTNTWNLHFLQQLFFPSQIQNILTITPNYQQPDQIIWPLTSTGHLTTKSAYNQLCCSSHQAQSLGISSQVWLKLWRLHIPYNLIFFIWKILNNILPVKTRLYVTASQGNVLCPLCQQDPETTTHLLLHF